MIEVSFAQLFEAWLLAVVFGLLSLRLGYTWALDKVRAVLVVEAFFRKCLDVHERREFRAIFGDVDWSAGNVIALDARRRATRIRMGGRPVA